MTGRRGKRLFTGDRPRGPVCRIVAAYVSGNALPADQLSPLIGSVHRVVDGLRGQAPLAAAGRQTRHNPANVAAVPATGVEIRTSITPNGIRSFEDGKLYRTLHRHLTSRGLDPQAYRSKWGLPPDYPMTCPAYSARRAAFARTFRLGHVSRT